MTPSNTAILHNPPTETPEELHTRRSLEKQEAIRRYTEELAGEIVLYTPKDAPFTNTPAVILQCADVEIRPGEPDVPICVLVHFEHGRRSVAFVDSARYGTGPGTWRTARTRLTLRDIDGLKAKLVAVENRLAKIEQVGQRGGK